HTAFICDAHHCMVFGIAHQHPMTNHSDRPADEFVDDEDFNTRANPRFADVLDARLSRRSLLRGGMGTAASALLGGVTLAGLSASGTPAAAATTAYRSFKNDRPITSLKFTPVAKSVADAI